MRRKTTIRFGVSVELFCFCLSFYFFGSMPNIARRTP